MLINFSIHILRSEVSDFAKACVFLHFLYAFNYANYALKTACNWFCLNGLQINTYLYSVKQVRHSVQLASPCALFYSCFVDQHIGLRTLMPTVDVQGDSKRNTTLL